VNINCVPIGYDGGIGNAHSVSPVQVPPETIVVVPVIQLNDIVFSCAQIPKEVSPVNTIDSELPEQPVHVTVHPLLDVIV
jgi:hypothetical protein